MKDNEMFDEKDNLTPEIEDVEISPAKEEKPDFKSNKEPKKRWYVVHTYSGHENKVKVNLEKRVEYVCTTYHLFFGSLLDLKSGF